MARIVVMSDIHLSPTHGFFWQNWCIARDFANMFNPEAIIVNGDLCINGPESDAEMAFAASAVRDLGDTVFALPGNHDVGDEPPGQDAEQIIDGERLARWNRFLGPDRWNFDVGNWRLIGANAQLFGSGLPQETEQCDWLNEQFSAAGSKPTALFLHKPLFIDSPDEVTPFARLHAAGGPQALLKLISGSGVRLVVSGHLHQSYREMTVEGIRYVWLPAVAFAATISLGGQRNCGLAIFDFSTGDVDIRIEYPAGLVSHDLDVIKQRGRYAFLRDMPPCPPTLDGVTKMNHAEFKSSALEEAEGDGLNPSGNRTMGEIVAARFSRRDFLGGSLAVSAIAATVGPMALLTAETARAASASRFSFSEVTAGVDEKHHIAEGYDADILLRWGDPLFPDAPEFDPLTQTAEKQRRQFGYNNDYVGFVPLEGSGAHGLLVVNHEYTNEHLMFPGIVTIVDGKPKIAPPDQTRVDIEMAAHGGTIAEIRKDGGKWRLVKEGKYNRRITATTEMALTGPAAGSDRLKTNADPTGRKVIGTVNDCAGGVTPWGTYIMAEENFNGYFGGNSPAAWRGGEL